MSFVIDVILSDGERQAIRVSADTAERARCLAASAARLQDKKKHVVGTAVLSYSGGWVYGKGKVS